MKPDTTTAIQQMIIQVRDTLPFSLPAHQLCAGPCRGCPKKLLEFIDQEIEDWENRLEQGEKPTIGEVTRFGKTCQKIYKAMAANKLV